MRCPRDFWNQHSRISRETNFQKNQTLRVYRFFFKIIFRKNTVLTKNDRKKPNIERHLNLKSNDDNLVTSGSLYREPIAFEVLIFISSSPPQVGTASADIELSYTFCGGHFMVFERNFVKNWPQRWRFFIYRHAEHTTRSLYKRSSL